MGRGGTARRMWGHAAVIAGGVGVGTVAALIVASAVTLGGERSERDPPSAGPTKLSPSAADTRVRRTSTPSTPKLLLAWTSGGLPTGTERMLQRLEAVRRVTTVTAGVDWLTATRSGNDTVIERAPKGLAIPLEVAAIDPDGYAAFVPPAERAAVASLRTGEAVFSQTSEDLRSTGGEGSTLELRDRDVKVTGTISDIAANGYEALIAGPPPASWAVRNRFVLVHLRRPEDRALVTRRIDGLLGPGQALRVRAKGETPFLRYGDAVLPQLVIKEVFGEFAGRPASPGTLLLDPAWRVKNIVTSNVPILGRVTCHRILIPQLRAALRQVAQEGLGFTINKSQYGGCHGARFIGLNPSGRLSHHTWGIAIDINVAENAFGTKPDQDPRLVKIFESHGFTWGGRWLVPDGMHFEWVAFS